MPIYVKIKNKLVPYSKPYWLLYVTNLVELKDYIDRVKSKQLVDSYWNAKNKLIRKPLTPHLDREEKCYTGIILNSDKKRETCFDDLLILGERIYGGMIKCLKETGAIFINTNGGFHPNGDFIEILETIEKDEYITPIDSEVTREELIKKININKWTGGTHYYAKVGDIDVKWNNELKWRTYERAKQCAINFIDNVILKK